MNSSWCNNNRINTKRSGMKFYGYLNEAVEFEDDDMGTIQNSPEQSMTGVCAMCEPHQFERCSWADFKNYSDWSLGRPKGHESYEGDGVPFRHKHCGCRWVSDSGAEAPSVKEMEE